MAFKIKNKVYDVQGNTYNTDVYVVFSSNEVNISHLDNLKLSVNLRFYKDLHSYNNGLSPITPILSISDKQRINYFNKDLTKTESVILNQQMIYSYVYDYLVSLYGKDYIIDCMGLLTPKETIVVPLMSGMILSGYTNYCGIDSVLSDSAEIGENDFSNPYGCNKNIKWLGSFNGSCDGGSSFKINVDKTGDYDVVICYTQGFNDGTHVLVITVNGTDYTQELSNSGGWSSEKTFTITIPLTSGDNTIMFHGDGDSQSPDFIYFQVPIK